ncbi:MAG: saccharopine dehydrogenase NADP-binding domain-containing protein [Candidatus Omnitrophica bacterium]|nr:saccharopine dehydrogenase NADP-binding domain-containing protein [Candidatus Omnitrophota bacterium]
MMVEFGNKILVIGYGSVSKCTLPVLFKHIKIPYKNVTVIDFVDQRGAIREWTNKGVKFFRTKITPMNMATELARHIGTGGLIIDLAWNIGCTDILTWCHDNRVLYVNTSIEEWDPYADIHNKTPMQKSLYYRHMIIREMISGWGSDSTTAVVDHGANPGLISHFTKRGLVDIACKAIKDKTTPKSSVKALEKYLQDSDFARIAMELDVKVIHCSERDTQIANKPKSVDEFVGTWSIEGLREEGISPAEMGWGTHEDKLPALAHIPHYGPKNQIFLARMGMNTWVRSWIPDQEIVGMVIRHGEAFGISDLLTVWKGKKAVYRPTVHYAYMPCHETISSLHELRARNYELQPKWRIMNDEITDGEDILGALLMGHKYNSWWTGSALSIKESRRLVPHQNATTLQVAIGVISAALWMIENPKKGFCLPDDLPHKYVLDIAKPYLGRFISEASSWTPFSNYQVFFKENKAAKLDADNVWSFRNFLFKP